MSIFLEIHALQSTPPCNMNRDQNGSPKTAFFGGMERLRVSSQCWKRAMRQYYKDTLPEHHKTYRDRAWGKELAKRLKKAAFDSDLNLEDDDLSVVLPVAWMLLSALKVKPNKGNYEEGIADALLFLGEMEISTMVELAKPCKDLLIKVAQNPPKNDDDVLYQLPGTIKKGLSGTYKSNPLEKLIEKSEFDELKKLSGDIQKILYDKKEERIKAVPGDVALFGRMMASLPIGSVDASATVAHAISTNSIKREFDYWTAAGDFAKEDTEQGQGGEHIGDRPFSSGVFYRYSCLDIEQLATNLGEKFKDDIGLILEHYLEAFLYSRPSGYNKQFGNDTAPFAGIFVIRHSQPLSLVQAFEAPIKAKGDESISQKSWHKIVQHWNGIQKAHGKRLPVEVVHVYSESLYEEDSKQITDNTGKEENDDSKKSKKANAHFYEDFNDAIEAAVKDVLKHQEGS